MVRNLRDVEPAPTQLDAVKCGLWTRGGRHSIKCRIRLILCDRSGFGAMCDFYFLLTLYWLLSRFLSSSLAHLSGSGALHYLHICACKKNLEFLSVL